MLTERLHLMPGQNYLALLLELCRHLLQQVQILQVYTQGVYVFTLTVTDNKGAKTSDNIQVTVNAAVPANKPPVANAGADFNITLPVNSVNLNGTASTDPDGSITTYLWTKLSGPAQFTLGNSGATSTTASNLAAGVYLIQLKVTDNQGAISQDTVKIIVNAAPVNQPPVANAGADMSITLPINTVNLNGASSSDPDGTISIYNWSQTSGPSQSSINFCGNFLNCCFRINSGSVCIYFKSDRQ